MKKEKDFKSILIADDDPDILEIMCDCLDDEKYRVVKAKDGAEATFKAKNEAFDLVITDMNMPKMSGDKLIKELKQDSPHIPILIVTGDIGDFKAHISLIPNITVIEKPFDLDVFTERVERLIDPRKFVEKEASKNRISIAPRQILIKQGDEPDRMYWLVSGKLQVRVKKSNGEETVLGEVKPGELVGEMSFIDNEPRSASVIALEQSDILVIPGGKFTKVLESQPQWFKSLVRNLSIRLRETNKKVDL